MSAILASKELALLVHTMRMTGLADINVRDISIEGLDLVNVKVPLVAHGWADLSVTLDVRLGTATWLLRDRVPTLLDCPDCRHMLVKSLLCGDLVDAFIGCESERLFVGCAGAPTVMTRSAIESLLASLPVVATNGREAFGVFEYLDGMPGFGLLAALSLTGLYDARPDTPSVPHPMLQSPAFTARPALPPALAQ